MREKWRAAAVKAESRELARLRAKTARAAAGADTEHITHAAHVARLRAELEASGKRASRAEVELARVRSLDVKARPSSALTRCRACDDH